MTAVINVYTVTGTPKEIAELIKELKMPNITISPGTGTYPVQPMRPYYLGDPDRSNFITLC